MADDRAICYQVISGNLSNFPFVHFISTPKKTNSAFTLNNVFFINQSIYLSIPVTYSWQSEQLNALPFGTFKMRYHYFSIKAGLLVRIFLFFCDVTSFEMLNTKYIKHLFTLCSNIDPSLIEKKDKSFHPTRGKWVCSKLTNDIRHVKLESVYNCHHLKYNPKQSRTVLGGFPCFDIFLCQIQLLSCHSPP